MILWVMNDRYCHALRLTLIVIDDMPHLLLVVPFLFVAVEVGGSEMKKYPSLTHQSFID